MLKIKDLTKTYPGGKLAVGGLSLSVKPGEIYGFIGHNGAGKSTTIRAVCGVMDFDGGEITVDGLDVRKNALEVKRRIAYVPDNPELYEFMTGRQYIALTADLYGVSAAQREELTARYAQLFGMEERLDELIGAYSHGMKQKTALIAALIHKPKLMVLDEPFVGLDPEASFHLKAVMRQLCGEGSAIFFSTHVLEVAQKLCDRVAIIRNGKLTAEGTMQDVIGDGTLEEAFMAEAEQ
ncbi:MAG: ABC transporter ATP-binding protein, partial [Clostridia bacterium]|nr:ABC transporter ATP-binding protein [Clostridia bacterium]